MNLLNMSIEELMQTEITSVSKKEQKIADAAAAVYVITKEDIRRSGANNIPDALRMVPGLEVASISSGTWAVQSRNVNSSLVNELLVLIDGRTIYSPIFGGVIWTIQDLPLEDIDRIEVIRGPGGTLWGANATTGVINIITKSSKDTVGTLASGGGGTLEQDFATVRQGVALSDDASFRAYAKYRSRGAFEKVGGGKEDDNLDDMRTGFRSDWQVDKKDLLTLQGDLFSTDSKTRETFFELTPPFSQSVTGDDTATGGNVLGRWERSISEESDFALQLYYDSLKLDYVSREVHGTMSDVDFQHRFRPFTNNEIVWGAGYRSVYYDVDWVSPLNTFVPEDDTTPLYSAFLQDETWILDKKLAFIVGTKVEHNPLTGIEVQPTARVIWTPNDNNSVWAAFSRAVRTPSFLDERNGLVLAVVPPDANGSPLTTRGFVPGENLDAEEVLSYELGWRNRPHPDVTLDTALFFADYSKQISEVAGDSYFSEGPPPHLVVPFMANNNMSSYTYGGELVARWQAKRWWFIEGSAALLELHSSDGKSNAVPRQQYRLRSFVDLPYNLELNSFLRYTDAVVIQKTPSYAELDLLLTWKATTNLELSVVGQNLLHNKHVEYGTGSLYGVAAEVPRGVYGKATLRF